MDKWRKFEFFEDVLGGKCNVPVKGKIVCCSSGRGKVAVGCDNGVVSLINHRFEVDYAFQAHYSSVLFLQKLKLRNTLLTVGENDDISAAASSLCLKVFDLDRIQTEGTETRTIIDCSRTLPIFTEQFPEAKITSFLALEDVAPVLFIAIGLENGLIHCIKGDVTRGRIMRFTLLVENASRGEMPITGLGFRNDGSALQLFAVTPSSISLFNLLYQPAKRHTLAQIGCSSKNVALSDRLELIIGRPEGVYFYEGDGCGFPWSFEGEKKFVGWLRGYLLCVMDPGSCKNIFNVYDLKNRLIAHSVVVNEVSHMICEWGNIILIMADKSALCVGEKDMESKLEILIKKNLFSVGINLLQNQQADAAFTAEVLRKYGDHLYKKQEYDEAISQYILTIGHLEPSYVIQKFSHAEKNHNLTTYLEKLHEKGLATKDHTTLLLNRYTKLNDVDKLDSFIKSETRGEIKFDGETVISVCRAANYHQHALSVARRAGKHELISNILLKDLGRYDEALCYISSLEPRQIGATVIDNGLILLEHRPKETIQLLLQLCTEEGKPTQKGALTMLPSPIDFVNIFARCPHYFIDFLEKYTDKMKDTPTKVEINNILLELYISHELSIPLMTLISSGRGLDDEVSLPLGAVVWSKQLSNGKSSNADENDLVIRRRKGLRLLRDAWPSDVEHPLYGVNRALNLCSLNEFGEGLLFLYEKMKLYEEMIAQCMQTHDLEGLIGCCKRLGESDKGRDPITWASILKYFADLDEDCSREVKEVLSCMRDGIISAPIVVQTLSRNQKLTVSSVEQQVLETYQEDTAAMRKELEDLRTQPTVFKLNNCTACSSALDLSAVHFRCMHSYHRRCLDDVDDQIKCPKCDPEYRSVLEKIELEKLKWML